MHALGLEGKMKVVISFRKYQWHHASMHQNVPILQMATLNVLTLITMYR